MDSAPLPRRLFKSSTPSFHPLNNDRYRQLFLDPLHTLLSSDNHQSSNATICLHDISEAYHTLMRRIQQHCSSLDSSSDYLPALEAFTQEKANLAYIIRRDILRALEPPNLDSSSQPHSPKDHADSLFDIHERLRRAHTDEVTACHGALKLVMEVFRSPAINTTLNGETLYPLGHSLRSRFVIIDDELIGCLGDTLRLLEDSNLPSFKGPMTHALCWAIMSTQKLPHTVLSTFETRIIRILKLYLPKLPPELVDDEETIIDGLQVCKPFAFPVTIPLTGISNRLSLIFCGTIPRLSSLRLSSFFPDYSLTSHLRRADCDTTRRTSWPPLLILFCQRLRYQAQTTRLHAPIKSAPGYQRSQSNISIDNHSDPTHHSQKT